MMALQKFKTCINFLKASHSLHFFKNDITNTPTKCTYTIKYMNYLSLILIIVIDTCIFGARGGVVVKTLRNKPAGREFDSRYCHWNFSVT